MAEHDCQVIENSTILADLVQFSALGVMLG